MIKALLLKADGSQPLTIKVPSQKETYEVIKDTISSPHGTWFDRICKESFHGYINDTGIIDGLRLNVVASVLFGCVVCGDVIVFGTYTPAGEWDGEEHDVPEFAIESVKLHWSLLNTNVDARNARLEVEDAGGRTTWSSTTAEFLNLMLANDDSSGAQR